MSSTSLYTRGGGHVYAATSSQLNFQARLKKANASLVTDGVYSIQFNLYTVSSGGTAEWIETNGAITVRDGYLSTYLGSITAFPGSIDWSADHWITMNVNGDGEMNPRIKLSSVPYAFRAGQADRLTSGATSLAADDLLQKAPLTIQSLNAAVAGLRFNQTGAGGLIQLQTSGTNVFTVDNTGNVVAAGGLTINGPSASIGTASQAGSLILSDGSSNTGTLSTAALGQNTNFILPDPGSSSATICLSTGNCGGTGDISQGGNNFAGPVIIGTNNNQSLQFETNNVTRLTLDTNGNANLTGGLTTGTGLTVTAGTITFGGLNTAGVVHTSATGVLSTSAVALGTDTSGSYVANLGTLTGLSTTGNSGAGSTPGLSVLYGSGANNAAAGSNTFTCASGSGNLTGGGTTVTIGTTGTTCAAISTNNDVTFSTATRTPLVTNAGALTVSTTGSNDLSINSGSGIINLAASTTLKTTTGLNFDLNNAANQVLTLVNNGAGSSSLNLSDGGLQTAGTTRLTNGGALQNVTGDNTNGVSFNANTITSGQLSVARGGTGIDGSAAANGSLLIGTGTGFANASLTSNGSITFTPGSGTLALNTTYGSSSTSAVRGDTTLVCPSGTGNLSGTGNSITLGTGGTCTALDTKAAVSFATSVTTPLVTNAGALSVQTTGGANALTLTSGSGTIIFGSDTLQRTSASLNLDVANGASNSTFNVTNSGAGLASLNVEGGISAGGLVTGVGLAAGTGSVSGTGGLSITGASSINSDTITSTSFTFGGASGQITTTTNGDLTLVPNGSGSLVLNTGSGGILKTNANTLQRIGATGLSLDLKDSAVTGLSLINSGSGATANLSASGLGTFGTGLTVTSGATNLGGTLDVAGNTLSSSSAAFTLLSAPTTVNAFGAATTLNLGLTSGTTTINGNTLTSSGLTFVGAAATTIKGATGQNVTIQSQGSGGLVFATGSNSIGLTPGSGSSVTFDVASGASNSSLIITNSGAGVAGLTVEGAISAAITGNTINNLVINNGALSAVTGFTQTSGNFGITGTGTFSTGTGAVSLNGAITAASSLNVTGLTTLTGGVTGAGLTNCIGGNNNLTFNSSTNNFGCATLDSKSFLSSTSVAVVDNNTTDYYRDAAENKNIHPNITLTNSANQVFGIVTLETTSTSNNDVEVSTRIERTTTGVNPVCSAATAVGGQPGTFSSSTGAQKASTVNFVDSPATTNQLRYSLCADTATVGTGANVTRIRFTLFELTNSADLAEVYPTNDLTLHPGEVVGLDPELNNGVVRSNKQYQQSTYGVVSTDPAMVIGGTGGAGKNGVAVALTGRVPVNVSTENGPIKKGDVLTSSSIPGVAMKATKAGAMLGIAMSDYDGSDIGQVTVFIKTGYYNGANLADLLSQELAGDKSKFGRVVLDKFLSDKTNQSQSLDLSDIYSDRLAAAVEIVTPKVTADTIDVQSITSSGSKVQVLLNKDQQFVIKNSENIQTVTIDDKGSLDAANFSSSGVLRLDSAGALLNINGLSLSSGGASIIGGVNNNNGGITSIGAISGATVVSAESLKLNASGTDNLLTLTKDDQGVFTVFNNGALELKLDSSNAFAVKDAAGTNILNIDSKTGVVTVGSGTADDKAVLFVLDNKNIDGDPTNGTNGAQYYNSKTNRFRCYQEGKWQDCISAGDVNRAITSEQKSLTLTSTDQEFPGTPRVFVDLGRSNWFRIDSRITAAGDQGATCRLQYATSDDGPWANLDANTDQGLSLAKTGTIKGDWASVAPAAKKGEVLVRVMCRGVSSSNPSFVPASPTLYGLTITLR